MTFEGGLDRELRARREAAWKSFWSLKHISKGKSIPIKSKIKILESYGAQTRAITENELRKTRVTQRAIERNILMIKKSNRIRHLGVRKTTEIMDVGYAIKKAKFRYLCWSHD